MEDMEQSAEFKRKIATEDVKAQAKMEEERQKIELKAIQADLEIAREASEAKSKTDIQHLKDDAKLEKRKHN